MAAIACDNLCKKLFDAGLVPEMCERIIIDIRTGDVVRVYYQTADGIVAEHVTRSLLDAVMDGVTESMHEAPGD